MRDLLDYRSEFPILEHTTYLASHTLGPMPRQAAERLAEFARMWAERGIRSWAEGWWATPMRVGDQIGRIVGAPPGSTVMHQNVAIAEAIALSCFRPVDPARNRVVYERGNFPSVRYLYQAQPDLEVVVCEDDAEIVERIDERTLLVPISHVLFKDVGDPGRRADRAPRARGRRARDPRLLPVGRDRPGRRHRARRRLRRRRLGEVALRRARRTAGCTSGPISPSGSSRPTRAGRRTSGRSRFEEEMEYAAGAARFLTGTPNPAAHFAGTAGYDLDRGDRRRADPRELAAPDRAAHRPRGRRGLRGVLTRDPARRGGAVIVSVPEAAAVYAELETRGILGDFRPGAGIRLGPHFFTTDDEIRFVVAQIDEIVETGACSQRHAGSRALTATRSSDARLRLDVRDGLGPERHTITLDVPANEREVPAARSSRRSHRRSSSRRCCPRSCG